MPQLPFKTYFHQFYLTFFFHLTKTQRQAPPYNTRFILWNIVPCVKPKTQFNHGSARYSFPNYMFNNENIHTKIIEKDISRQFCINLYLTIGYMLYKLQCK